MTPTLRNTADKAYAVPSICDRSPLAAFLADEYGPSHQENCSALAVPINRSRGIRPAAYYHSPTRLL